MIGEQKTNIKEGVIPLRSQHRAPRTSSGPIRVHNRGAKIECGPRPATLDRIFRGFLLCLFTADAVQ
jgi:hypothetical protein